jgi:DNA sulfur modification protein DndC
MHMELMSRLLDTERQYYTKSRRTGIYETLDKCFDISSRSKDEAIENAHLKRDLKMASLDGNINTVKQLSWGNIKFKEPM